LLPVQPPVAVQLVALVVDQVNVVDPPLVTLGGVADSDTVGGGGGAAGATVTVTDCDADTPPAAEHVNVKVDVVVRPGRASLPLSAFVPLHAPDALQVTAFVEVQVSVVLPPLATVVGFALSVTAGDGGAAGGVTVTVTDCEALPPEPVQFSV
jgi:hypothetical protein